METKRELFTEEEKELAEIGKALSHPARIKILKILGEMDVCMTGSIVEKLPLAQSTVSQHLKELKRVGLVKGEIEGPRTCYCINKKVVEKAEESFMKLITTVNKGGKC